MDHDQRFKHLIKEFLVDFMRLFFADWLDLIDVSEVEWLEQEITPEPPDGPRHVLDLVAKVRSREQILPWHLDANDVFALAMLIEIESPDNSTSIRRRVPGYARNLRHKLQMPVLPVVLFLKVGLDGVGKLVYEERIRDLVTEFSECLYVGLPHFDALEYVNGDNWLGVALSALMRIPPDQVAALGAEALRRIAGSPLTDRQKFLLGGCVQAYLPLTEEQSRQLAGILETTKYSEVKAMNLTSYDKGMIQGEKVGFEKGILKGRLEASLELRFGEAGLALMERLRGIDQLDVLDRLVTHLRTSATLEEFERAIP